MIGKELDQEMWREYAIADLESAELLLRETENYQIIVYHAHQAVEKMLKYTILKQGKELSYTHDLLLLFRTACTKKLIEQSLEAISFLMDLFTSSKYPHGDKITKEEAVKSIELAKQIIDVVLSKEDKLQLKEPRK